MINFGCTESVWWLIQLERGSRGETICSFHKFQSDILWTAHMRTCSILGFPSFILYTFSWYAIKTIMDRVASHLLLFGVCGSTFNHCNRFWRSGDWGMNFYTRQSTEAVKNETCARYQFGILNFLCYCSFTSTSSCIGAPSRDDINSRDTKIFLSPSLKMKFFKLKFEICANVKLNMKKFTMNTFRGI